MSSFVQEIKKSLMGVLGEMGDLGSGEPVVLEHPADLSHGDYSTNIAMVVSAKCKVQSPVPSGTGQSAKLRNPRELAEMIIDKWQTNGLPEFVEKIEVAGAGFLNIWLNFNALGTKLAEVLNEKEKFGSTDTLEGKKILLEHTSPNTNKSLHVGHIRNNITGMSISRILEFNGAKVTKDCLFNDRGIHICKVLWGYLYDNLKVKSGKCKVYGGWRELINYWFDHQDEWPSPEEQNIKPDKFVEGFYGKGVQAEEEEKNKKEMQEMLLAWEENDPKVRALWQKMNNWVYRGFKLTFSRLQSSYDHAWYESEFYVQAKAMVDEGMQKKILKKLPDGAILTNLEKMGLPDTIVQRADGTSMYFTQDIYLTSQKVKKFSADEYIWIVGPEQQLHLKQVFAVCEQMGIAKREQFNHLWYGYVFLRGKGKMSSRAGTVISADELMDEAKKRAEGLIRDKDLTEEQKGEIGEKVGLGAIKYSLLKLGRMQDVYFDWGESINLQGNSGPYLQYTYARTQSVLAKAGLSLQGGGTTTKQSQFISGIASPAIGGIAMTEEETILLRTLYRFPEAVEEAGKTYSPNLICNFLFDLAQKFNLFYDKNRILANSTQLTANSYKQKAISNKLSAISGISKEQSNFRLALTAAIGQVLKNGLNLLGIESLERM